MSPDRMLSGALVAKRIIEDLWQQKSRMDALFDADKVFVFLHFVAL